MSQFFLSLNKPSSSSFSPQSLYILDFGSDLFLNKRIGKWLGWKQRCESTETLVHSASSCWNSNILGGKQLKVLTVLLEPA